MFKINQIDCNITILTNNLKRPSIFNLIISSEDFMSIDNFLNRFNESMDIQLTFKLKYYGRDVIKGILWK